MCELGKRAHVSGLIVVHVDIYEKCKTVHIVNNLCMVKPIPVLNIIILYMALLQACN